MNHDEIPNKILVVDPIHSDAVKYLEENGFSVTHRIPYLLPELPKLANGHDVLICRTSTKLDNNFFTQASHLKCVALASTGYDQIDIESARRNNVTILGLPSSNKNIDTSTQGNFISTAEHTILLILSALGDTHNAVLSLENNKWEKSDFVGYEAYQKTLGLIGFGRIGKLVAVRAQAFGMNVIAYDPYVTSEEMKAYNTTKVDLEILLKESSIITIHAPKTPETIDLLNQAAFDKVKPGVILVNVARSEIVNTDALLKALDDGTVHRYATDVHKNEPYDIEWHVIKHSKVIATPHIAGSTQEALRRISLSTVQSIINFVKNNDNSNVIS